MYVSVLVVVDGPNVVLESQSTEPAFLEPQG